MYPGVRAILVTKTKQPKWNPPSIEDVTEESVLSYLQPLPNNEDLPMYVLINQGHKKASKIYSQMLSLYILFSETLS